MNLLLQEIRNFSKNNWWIYIIFLICIWIIYKTDTWNIFEITLIVLFHFLWDIFLMMMWDSYAIKEYKRWTIYQLICFLIVFSVCIYSYFSFWESQYLLVEILFWFSALRSYFILINSKKVNYFHPFLFIFLAIFIFYFFLLSNPSFYSILQLFWLSIVAFSLALDSDRKKYFLFSFWTFICIIASWIWVYINFLNGNVFWTSISFTLFPLTVFVFYLKNLKSYL